jgi:hypothetical protein
LKCCVRQKIPREVKAGNNVSESESSMVSEKKTNQELVRDWRGLLDTLVDERSTESVGILLGSGGL